MGIDWGDFKLQKAKEREPASSWIPAWNVAEPVGGLIRGRLILHTRMTFDVVGPEPMFKPELKSLVFQLPTKFLHTLASQRVLRECRCAPAVETHVCLGMETCWVACSLVIKAVTG